MLFGSLKRFYRIILAYWRPMNSSSNILRDLLKKEVSTDCTFDGDEESFDIKEIAFETCWEIIGCHAIYDSDCDGEGPFKVCKNPENVVNGQGSTSCIYRKIKDGKSQHGKLIYNLEIIAFYSVHMYNIFCITL